MYTSLYISHITLISNQIHVYTSLYHPDTSSTPTHLHPHSPPNTTTDTPMPYLVDFVEPSLFLYLNDSLICRQVPHSRGGGGGGGVAILPIGPTMINVNWLIAHCFVIMYTKRVVFWGQGSLWHSSIPLSCLSSLFIYNIPLPLYKSWIPAYTQAHSHHTHSHSYTQSHSHHTQSHIVTI